MFSIKDGSFKSFENGTVKLLVKETKWASLEVRIQHTFLENLISKYDTGGPFLERPGKLTGPKSYFEIKFSRKVGCVLTSNEVHFVSLAENSTVQFSNLLKLLSRMKNKTA